MLLTLKWMVNLQQIECHQKICHLFFMFNLTCCKFVALKENALIHSFQNHYSKQTNYSSEFSLQRDQDVTLREGIGEVGPPERLKLGTFPFCWISPPVPLPSLDHRPHIGKKVALIAFKQILRNNLSAVYIFSNIIMTNLKKLIVNKSLNTKQCPAGLSSRIISLNLYGKPCEQGRISANSQQPNIY